MAGQSLETKARFLPRSKQFLSDAAHATGLSDYGDPLFGEGYERFLAALDSADRLTPAGAVATAAQIDVLLRTRLRTIAAWKANPGYERVEIRRPLIITGIVRSGTTALHRLLTVDPQFIGIPHWLVRAPRPLPPVESWAADPDYQAAKAVLDQMIAHVPEMLNDHMMTVDAVEESIFSLAPTFTNNMFPSQWTVPDYDAWYRTANERPCYRWLADTLRLVGMGHEERPWLMKNPTDLRAIDAVLDAFSDARIIHTHRDPVQAIPSIANLLLSVRRMFEGDNADPAQILTREAEFWAEGLARLEAVKAAEPERFADIQFGAFVRDQMAAVEAIYDRFDLVLDGQVADAMRAWLDDNPRRPGHIQRHRAEDFGIATGWVADIYRDYRARYGYA